MKPTSRKIAALFLSLVLLTTFGCAGRSVQVRPDPTTGQPARAVTPFERALAANLVLATTNNLLVQGLIEANALGLLPTPLTSSALKACKRVAQVDNEITTILEKGPAFATSNAQELQAKFDELLVALIDTKTLDAVGVTNPKSQTTFREDAAAARALAGSVLNFLKLAGVLK